MINCLELSNIDLHGVYYGVSCCESFIAFFHYTWPEKDAQGYIWLDEVEESVIYHYSTCGTDAAFRIRRSRPYLDLMVVEMTNVFIKGISYKYSVCGLYHQKGFVLFHQMEP